MLLRRFSIGTTALVAMVGAAGCMSTNESADEQVTLDPVEEAAEALGAAIDGCNNSSNGGGFASGTGTLTLVLGASSKSLVLSASSGRILANGIACASSGTALTTTNVKKIAITGTSGNDSIVIDQLAGGLGTNLLGGSANSGIAIATGGGTDTVGFRGTNSADTYKFATASGKHYADLNNDAKADVEITPGASTVSLAVSTGNGADTVTGNGGPTSFRAGAAFTTGALNSAVALTVYGGNGNDTLTGGAGNDALYGGGDNDTFVATSASDGADVFSGDAGTGDTVDYSARSGNLTVDVGFSTAYVKGSTNLTAISDWTPFTGGGQLVLELFNGASGSGTTHTITFQAGDNTAALVAQRIDGHANYSASVGPNNELLLRVQTGGDRFRILPASTDTVTTALGLSEDATLKILAAKAGPTATADYNRGNDGLSGEYDDVQSTVEVVTGGTGVDTFTGNDLKNTLNGGSGADVLEGWPNATCTSASATGDVLAGGEGDDTLKGGAKNCYATYTPGNGTDILDWSNRSAATTINLTVATATNGEASENATLAAFETAKGGSGVDTITGTSADETIYGYNGADVIDGGAGNDTIVGGLDADSIKGGEGDDTITPHDGTGNPGAADAGDIVNGGNGFDSLDMSTYSVATSIGVCFTSPTSVAFTGTSPCNATSGTASSSLPAGSVDVSVLAAPYFDTANLTSTYNDLLGKTLILKTKQGGSSTTLATFTFDGTGGTPYASVSALATAMQTALNVGNANSVTVTNTGGVLRIALASNASGQGAGDGLIIDSTSTALIGLGLPDIAAGAGDSTVTGSADLDLETMAGEVLRLAVYDDNSADVTPTLLEVTFVAQTLCAGPTGIAKVIDDTAELTATCNGSNQVVIAGAGGREFRILGSSDAGALTKLGVSANTSVSDTTQNANALTAALNGKTMQLKTFSSASDSGTALGLITFAYPLTAANLATQITTVATTFAVTSPGGALTLTQTSGYSFSLMNTGTDCESDLGLTSSDTTKYVRTGEGDSYANFEVVQGGSGVDTITALGATASITDQAVEFYGNAGNDVLTSATMGGTLDGGADTDTVSGLDGETTCVDAETTTGCWMSGLN